MKLPMIGKVTNSKITNIKTIIFYIILSLFSVSHVNAESIAPDTVYMNDGTILLGQVKKINSNSIKIQIRDSSGSSETIEIEEYTLDSIYVQDERLMHLSMGNDFGQSLVSSGVLMLLTIPAALITSLAGYPVAGIYAGSGLAVLSFVSLVRSGIKASNYIKTHRMMDNLVVF